MAIIRQRAVGISWDRPSDLSDRDVLKRLSPAAVIIEILREDGSMARLPDLLAFAAKHRLKTATIAQLIEYRRQKLSFGFLRFTMVILLTCPHCHKLLGTGAWG